MSSPVVVDGRLTREKLDELIAVGAEHPELDFKATLDLRDNAAHRLGLVKDVIAMANSATGGYLVVGAHDDGQAASDQAQIVPQDFDSADLAQLIARYVVTAPIVTSQMHDIDGRWHALLHVAPTVNRLPILVSKSGEYDDGGRMKSVFRGGVIYVREGTRTVAANDAHWPVLLERYRDGIVAETREGIDVLIKKVVDGIADSSGGVSLSPLLAEMDEAAFVEAAQTHFDSPEGERRLKRFVQSLRRDASIRNADSESRLNALDRISILAIEALQADARDIFSAIVTTLHDNYDSSVSDLDRDNPTQEKAAYWLELLLRVQCIGAVAVREQAWWAMVPLVDRPGDSYYPIWLRHGLVYASRAHLLSGSSREASLFLIRARALAAAHPALGAGVAAPELDDESPIPEDDALLDSLCQFDFLWCVLAVLRHPGEHDSTLFYPSCAALFQSRAQPMISKLATSDTTRDSLASDVNVKEWATALERVMRVAVSQSYQYGGWWDFDHDYRVESFIREHATDTE